jgi:hypothetical protein
MRDPTNSQHWTLRNLVYCGYCEHRMYPAQQPGGPRAYRCGPPCERSVADANGLELMAHRAAVPAIPGLAEVAARTDLTPVFAERYRRVIVYGNLTHVRFVGRYDRPPVTTQLTVTLAADLYAWLDATRDAPPILVLETGGTELCLVLGSERVTAEDVGATRHLAELTAAFAAQIRDRQGRN